MSFFSHLGKSSDSYVLQLHIHDVSPLLSCEALHCVVKRSSKEFHTRMAMGDGRACSWEETIRMISTLYRAKPKDKKPAPFDAKVYTFIVQTDKASKQRSSLSVSANAVANAASASHAAASAAAAQSSKSILMSVDIDLAAFAVPEHLGTEVTRSFALKAMKGGGDGGAAAAGLTPMLKVTFKVSLVKKGENIPSMSKSALATVDEQQRQPAMIGLKPNKRTKSISEISPVQANSKIDSYSRQAGEELSPDLTKRPRRVVVGGAEANDENDDEHSGISRRQHTPSGGRAEAENADGSAPSKNLYGNLENPSPRGGPPTKTRRSTGKAALDEIKQKKTASSPRAADGAHSYASGVAEDVMTPPSAAQPAPAQTDSVSALPPFARRPSHAIMSPAERKRRSDTQIFTAIMTNELSSPIAGDDKPPLSRRASHLNPPQSAPAQPDSPAALVRSPSTRHAGLRVSTSNADIAGSNRNEIKSAAAARPTPATADDGAYTSYADLGDDDVPSPQQLAQQGRGSSHGAVEADAHADDNDDAVAPSSFADRHSELTVDDVLSPFGHSGAPSRPASTAGSHARLPSMFVTKSSDRNAVTKLFSSTNKNNYSRTADSALVLPKKGSSNDKEKTGSGGRGSFLGNSSGGDSQPSSAASARTPQLTAAASFTGPMSFASLSDPALMKKMTSKRDLAPEHERSISGASRSRQSIDEMLDGNHLAIGGHSQHNSRQASRSPSPSRSTGSSGGTAGSSVGSSLPSYISGTFLPTASPRQNSKPCFPHSSPAKHSAAHVVSRVNGRSPFSSLSKEESRMLSTGGASASSTMSSAGGSEAEAEAGSLASYRAAMKQQKLRSSSRSNNSTPYSSLQLPVVADHGVGAASKTLPLRVSSGGGGINVAPPSPRSGGTRGLATGSLGRDASAALSRSNPTPITAAEATKLERDFFVRMRGSVDLLCDQLHIPDLFDAEQSASDGAAAAAKDVKKDRSPSPASSPNPAANPSGTPLKSMWSSVKARLASPSSSSASAQSAAAARSSGASTPVTPSAPPSPAGPQAKAAPADPFFHGVPVWSCLVVRCLHAWDAFAVSTFAADPSSKSPSSSDDASSAITRSAGRSWILSAVLAHLHKTGLFLCARSAAGQRQNALCFFITQLATLIQLVEGFSRSSVAPAPYPLLDDGPASPSSDAAAPAASGPDAHTARYAQALRVPSLPEGFTSWRGMYVVAQLPQESTHRVSEWARAQIKALGGAGQGVAGKGAGSAPQPSPAATASNSALFPYSLSLGVSTYSWFLAHLRALLCTVYQCLLELVLTELEIVDPASILSAVDADPMSDSVGYEHTLEQLLATYHKIGDDALRNCMTFPLRTHLFASLFAHLNSAMFNAVLGNMSLMNMTTGMRLKVITKSMQEWARGFGDDGHGGSEAGAQAAAGDKDAPRESVLFRVCNSELEMCNQLSLLLLMDKRGLTLNDLSAQCSALTPVSLYHLLLNYLPVSSAAAASAAGAPPSARSSSDLICDSILDELSTYQTDVLSHLAARSSGPGPRVLFPAWRVAGLRSRRLDVCDDDDEDDGRECVYGAHLRAQSASAASASDAQIQSPFLAPMQRVPLPRCAVAASSGAASASAASAKSSATSPARTSLLPLSSVPVPAALLQEGGGAFACLQRQDQLCLPITRGTSSSQ